MAKEEKPFEYQRRIRDTKGVAQRLDFNYLKQQSPLGAWKRRLTWSFVALAALASVPLITGFGGGRRAVMNGPVSSAHAIFQNDCESCHTSAFAGIQDEACEVCHDGAPHPAKSIDTGRPRNAPHCADCHLEHQGRIALAGVASANCTGCHSDLASHGDGMKLKGSRITEYRPGGHPEFSTASLTDTRPLKLNHAIHMPSEPKTIRGMKLPMKCADCHVTDRNSRSGDLLPVTFERNCKSCHARELEFDIHHVLGPDAAPAPHTRNRDALREHIAAAYRGRPDGESLTRESEAFLYDRKCGYCHEGQPPATATSAGVRGRSPAGESWLPRAEFDHRSHRAVACESCHVSARASSRTSDVLMPKMASCLPCHGDSQSGLDRCGLCHVYHNRALEKDVERKFGGTR